MSKLRQNDQDNFNFIDLFAGAGGLSEGFLQAGFRPVAHVEMNEFAAKTLETRSAYYYLKGTDNLAIYKKYMQGKMTREGLMKNIPASIIKTIINETMSDETLPSIFKTIDGIMKIRGIKTVDVIVGGPPCQAYSLVGRAQSSHMEVPMEEDPRNYLYKLYARFLKRYTPMGPCIVTADEIDDAHNLNICCYVNDEKRQESNTKYMITSVEEAISELSQGMLIKAGTIIATGTPGGVAMGMKPPIYLKSGDEIRCEIQGIGSLVNKVG